MSADHNYPKSIYLQNCQDNEKNDEPSETVEKIDFKIKKSHADLQFGNTLEISVVVPFPYVFCVLSLHMQLYHCYVRQILWNNI